MSSRNDKQPSDHVSVMFLSCADHGQKRPLPFVCNQSTPLKLSKVTFNSQKERPVHTHILPSRGRRELRQGPRGQTPGLWRRNVASGAHPLQASFLCQLS